MSLSRIFTSQVCLLTLFAKIKFSQKFPNYSISQSQSYPLSVLIVVFHHETVLMFPGVIVLKPMQAEIHQGLE